MLCDFLCSVRKDHEVSAWFTSDTCWEPSHHAVRKPKQPTLKISGAEWRILAHSLGWFPYDNYSTCQPGEWDVLKVDPQLAADDGAEMSHSLQILPKLWIMRRNPWLLWFSATKFWMWFDKQQCNGILWIDQLHCFGLQYLDLVLWSNCF